MKIEFQMNISVARYRHGEIYEEEDSPFLRLLLLQNYAELINPPYLEGVSDPIEAPQKEINNPLDSEISTPEDEPLVQSLQQEVSQGVSESEKPVENETEEDLTHGG